MFINAYAVSFSDGATTFGNIESRGGKTVTISDLADPAGINVLAIGGGAPATVSACGFEGTISFDSGGSADITCGSVTIHVITGTVDISYMMNGMSVTAQMITDITINPEPGTVSIQNQSGMSIMVMINGNPTQIEAGKTFEFQVPPDNPQVGGEIIPINTAALLLAGAQSVSWLVPILLLAAGIGFVFERKRQFC